MVKAPPSVSIQKWVIGRLHWNFPVHQTFGIKRFCNPLRIPRRSLDSHLPSPLPLPPRKLWIFLRRQGLDSLAGSL